MRNDLARAMDGTLPLAERIAAKERSYARGDAADPPPVQRALVRRRGDRGDRARAARRRRDRAAVPGHRRPWSGSGSTSGRPGCPRWAARWSTRSTSRPATGAPIPATRPRRRSRPSWWHQVESRAIAAYVPGSGAVELSRLTAGRHISLERPGNLGAAAASRADAVPVRADASRRIATGSTTRRRGRSSWLSRRSPQIAYRSVLRPSGPPQGLYDPADEKDSCGVAFLADLKGRASHAIVAQALTALHNLDHRGAAGAEPSSGDGAGITVAVPGRVPARGRSASSCPPAGAYAVGNRLPAGRADARPRRRARSSSRRRPTRAWSCSAGATCRSTPPASARRPERDAALRAGVRRRRAAARHGLELERLAFCARKVAERRAREAGVELYFSSLSARTLVYKGMLTTDQLGDVLPRPDRSERSPARSRSCTAGSRPTRSRPGRSRTRSATSPTTARSTRSRATATGCSRAQALLESDLIPGDLRRLFPICTPGRERLGILRRGARAAAPGRPQPAARRADDGARGLGERRRHGRRPGARSTSSTPR